MIGCPSLSVQALHGGQRAGRTTPHQGFGRVMRGLTCFALGAAHYRPGLSVQNSFLLCKFALDFGASIRLTPRPVSDVLTLHSPVIFSVPIQKLSPNLVPVGAVPAITLRLATPCACKSAKPVLPLQTRFWAVLEVGSPSCPDVKPELTKTLAPARAAASAARCASPSDTYRVTIFNGECRHREQSHHGDGHEQNGQPALS